MKCFIVCLLDTMSCQVLCPVLTTTLGRELTASQSRRRGCEPGNVLQPMKDGVGLVPPALPPPVGKAHEGEFLHVMSIPVFQIFLEG